MSSEDEDGLGDLNREIERSIGSVANIVGGQDAHDVTQTACVKLIEKIRGGKLSIRKDNFGPYVGQTFRNAAIDVVRQERNSRHLPLREDLISSKPKNLADRLAAEGLFTCVEQENPSSIPMLRCRDNMSWKKVIDFETRRMTQDGSREQMDTTGYGDTLAKARRKFKKEAAIWKTQRTETLRRHASILLRNVGEETVLEAICAIYDPDDETGHAHSAVEV